MPDDIRNLAYVGFCDAFDMQHDKLIKLSL